MASKVESEYCCVRCGQFSLVSQVQVSQAQALNCQSCGMRYPIVHNVPILFPDVVITAAKPSADTDRLIKLVCDHQGLTSDAETLETIKAIFCKNYRFADFLIDTESQQYINRIKTTLIQQNAETVEMLRLSALLDELQVSKVIEQVLPSFSQQWRGKLQAIFSGIQRFFIMPFRSVLKTMPVKPFPLQYEWVLDYLPRTILAKQPFTGNVRLHNIGSVPISSQGSTPVMISYHWHSPIGKVLSTVVEHRTPFPIDLQPGRQITLPMLIEPPEQAGKYELELCLVQQSVCWHEKNSIRISIEIVTQPPLDSTTQWQKKEHIYGYLEDHQQGIDLLKSQLKTLNRSNPKILEIGGNAAPIMFLGFSGQLYNLDIDVHGLQIGHLTNQSHLNKVTFLCADANAIPFPDDYFDCITIFASLHHFPDLRMTLRSLAPKIHAQGFLAVMCEPVGHPYGEGFDPLFREELCKGVNEQSFSLSEYAAIFADAGLIVEAAIVDGQSLKAFLKKPSALEHNSKSKINVTDQIPSSHP